MIEPTNNYLLEGDPMEPSSMDLIAQLGRLPVGKPVPEGWRIMTGNAFDSLVTRVAYRFEIEKGN